MKRRESAPPSQRGSSTQLFFLELRLHIKVRKGLRLVYGRKWWKRDCRSQEFERGGRHRTLDLQLARHAATDRRSDGKIYPAFLSVQPIQDKDHKLTRILSAALEHPAQDWREPAPAPFVPATWRLVRAPRGRISRFAHVARASSSRGKSGRIAPPKLW